MPARFLRDRGGVIHAADADPDYRKRPETLDSIAVLDRLPC